MYGAVKGRLFVIEIFECLIKMDEKQRMYDNIMFEEADINEQNEDKTSVKL